MNCRFCNQRPPIDNSHVVSKFLVKHIKVNGPSNFILNSWSNRREQDGIKGAYLCSECDNIVFSDWENFFKRKVFDCRDQDTTALSEDNSIKFVLSIVFRYSVHFLETSPITQNRDNNNTFRDLSHRAINDLSIIGKELFIYPFIFKPITEECQFMPGVNHFLNLAFHAVSLPEEDGLPNAFLLILPSMMFLITDGDLSLAPANELANAKDLQSGMRNEWRASNTNMPEFLSTILNRCVGQSQAHQRNINLWYKISYGIDKLIHPNKLCYKCQELDSNLLRWQRKNCANK